MRLQLYDIIPQLQPYVKLICSMDCDNDADSRHIRVLPDACVELFISYTNSPVAVIGGKLYKNSIVTFRMSRPMDVQMRKGSGCLAICFYPGRAYRFLNLPMNLVTDTTTPLDDIWKGIGAEIEDKLAGVSDNTARVSIIQQHLVNQLASGIYDRQIDYCLKQASSSIPAVSVSELTKATGLSQRQLSRKFQTHVGLSPKEYLRVSRFIRSLPYLKKKPAMALTNIAYENGFYDQAHFIRDYKYYTGHTPGEIAGSGHILF